MRIPAVRAGSLSWLTGALKETEPLLMKFISPVLFLLRQVKKSAEKKPYSVLC